MRVFLIIIIVTLFAFPAHALFTFDEIKTAHKLSEAVLLDRHGDVIQDLRVNLHC